MPTSEQSVKDELSEMRERYSGIKNLTALRCNSAALHSAALHLRSLRAI